MTRPTALYLRVSGPGQVGDDKFGLDVQRHEAQRYAQRSGLTIVQTYQDVITGRSARREQLDLLLEQAARYETVLISSVDRLARREAPSYAVLDELLETGLEVHSADMGRVDPDDETSALNFGIRTVFAAADARRIVKRLRAGMVAKVRAGKPVVPIEAYGWRGGEHLEDEAQWVRQIYHWARVDGWTIHTIVTELNRLGVPRRQGARWCHSTLKYILRNPLYKGVYTFGRSRPSRGDGRDLVTCEVAAIIPPDEWEATQRAIDRRKTGGRPAHKADAHEFAFTKRLTCGHCGGTMTGITNPPRENHSRKTPYRYYQCYRIRPRDGYWGEPCTHNRAYSTKKLHPFIREQLAALVLDDAALLAAMQVEPPKPVDTSAAVAAVDKRLRNLKLLALDGGMSPAEYRETREELEAQRAALTAPPSPLPLVPPNLTAARERIAQALASEDLNLVVKALDVRATLYKDGRVDLRLSAL